MADKVIALSAEEIEANLQFVNNIEVGTVTLTANGKSTAITGTVDYQKPHSSPVVFLSMHTDNHTNTNVVVPFVKTVGTTNFTVAIMMGDMVAGVGTSVPEGDWKVNYIIIG